MAHNPVSYTHLDVYKRQLSALHHDLIARLRAACDASQAALGA